MYNVKLDKNEILVFHNYNNDIKSLYSELKIGSIIESNNWNPDSVYDGGFYGLPWGEGCLCHVLLNYDVPFLLSVVNTDKDYIYGIGEMTNRCKFKNGRIIYIGDKEEAIQILQEMAPIGSKIVFSKQYGINNSNQIAGDYSSQSAGDNSRQSSGINSIQIAGKNSYQNAGILSVQIAENNSYQESEEYTTQKAGNFSNQKAGFGCNQTSGDNSIQIAKNRAVQETGNNSVQIAGLGTIQITRWNNKISTRFINKKTANIPYRVLNGVWIETTIEECMNYEK